MTVAQPSGFVAVTLDVATTSTSEEIQPRASFAEVAIRGDTRGFQEVQRRRQRNRSDDKRPAASAGVTKSNAGVIIGTKHGETSVIAGVRRKPFQSKQAKGGIFISRLRPTTSCSDVETYVFSQTNLRVKCVQLKARHDSYKSFRILTGNEQCKKLLVPDIWPQHVVVKL